MLRGFATDDEQEEVLIAAGVQRRAIYRELEPAIFSLRPGDMLAVAGLHPLGKTRFDVSKAVDSVHAKKCFVFDATTKLTTAKHRDRLIANASNARRGPSKRNRMPLDLVKVFWFDKLLRNKQVMERVNGDRRYKDPWSYTVLWRELGDRDALKGRPAKAK